MGRLELRRVAFLRLGMTLLIAWRNLAHDRVRFFVTQVGIVFSVVLMGMQLGLLLSFVRTTASLVDHAGADIWITAAGAKTVDIATPIQERWRWQAQAVPGVAKAEAISVDFAIWKRPDGVRESVILVGIAGDATMAHPWLMTGAATVEDALAVPDGVIVDRLYAKKLGVSEVGEVVEINDQRARVVAFTSGIRTFTQSPYVFTTIKNSRRFSNRAADHASYVLVKLEPGADALQVAETMRARMPNTDVKLAELYSTASATYWLFTTGAGISLIMTGVLGLLVGGVIVAQTLYASTMDRLPEYATIRAMGGPAHYLNKIVLLQALIAGSLGYAQGIAIVLFMVQGMKNSSASPQMPLWLASAIGATTLFTCIAAALVSLRKVSTIDPAKVFR
ncbi:MAG: FtsX-like permease family protein [Alphaproteobacteria bacterium]|nr:FtsX-like permease family protein [Alphaproteobacteria bacterium]